MAIDFGTKRCGLAVTDPLQLIPTGLDAVRTEDLLPFLQDYLACEEVETIVLGEPLHTDGQPSRIHHLVIGLFRKLKKLFPSVNVKLQDEGFSSVAAREVIRQSGVRRKKRRDKALLDKVSAVMILKDYLESQAK